MLNPQDIEQIKERGSDLDTVKEQIESFKHGFPFLKVIRAASVPDGIKKLNEKELNEATGLFDQKSQDSDIVKFVPASGAASRMFKALFQFIEDWNDDEESYEKLTADQGFQSVFNFFKNIENFAFYQDLKEAYEKDGKSLSESLLKREYVPILKTLLEEDGLGYGQLPKGLLKFHNYNGGSRTALEEHLVEAAVYGKSGDGTAKIHFTVSPEHQEKFEALVSEVKGAYESKYDVKFEIGYSIQKPSTDTIAVTPENEPFRENDGKLFFRPGGHGALIENLNDIKADIIFIKNIDNVVPDHLKDTTYTYKKALAGVLLQFQDKIFSFLKKLDEPGISESELDVMLAFLQHELHIDNILDFDTAEGKRNFIKSKLDRPIRVCGMVVNEGEPGGGPYFAENADGTYGLQIAESSQIDTSNDAQQKIMSKATHFNPVDLVCATKDYKGQPFDLTEYVDPETGFISSKSKNGKPLKALELPGLWNGAMSDWNTLFVEVPIETFNPVKTVNDLLRPQHQGA